MIWTTELTTEVSFRVHSVRNLISDLSNIKYVLNGNKFMGLVTVN